jgi:dipeptidyl aminopeptidase/acylaminoacyl peptidase
MGRLLGAGAGLRCRQGGQRSCGSCRSDGRKPPRRITNTKAPEDDVAWSPDSGSIAFSTKREGDEVEQIYILDLARRRRCAASHHDLDGREKSAMAARR